MHMYVCESTQDEAETKSRRMINYQEDLYDVVCVFRWTGFAIRDVIVVHLRLHCV